ncbi:unnamed protein product [Brassica rapa subsp. narinosa]
MHVSVWSSLVVVALLRFRIYEDGVRVLWFLRPSVVVVVVDAGGSFRCTPSHSALLCGVFVFLSLACLPLKIYVVAPSSVAFPFTVVAPPVAFG